MRKPVFGVSDEVRHKSGCAATEDGYRLELSDLGRRGIVLSVWRKQRRAVTAQLICAFVFACAKSRFSHDEAHISILCTVDEILHYLCITKSSQKVANKKCQCTCFSNTNI